MQTMWKKLREYPRAGWLENGVKLLDLMSNIKEVKHFTRKLYLSDEKITSYIHKGHNAGFP